MSLSAPIDIGLFRTASRKATKRARPAEDNDEEDISDKETTSCTLSNQQDNIFEVRTIAALTQGPGYVMFTGRVVAQYQRKVRSKLSTAAKLFMSLIVSDGTGAIQLKIWLTKPNASLQNAGLGSLIVVRTTFTFKMPPKEMEKSPATTDFYVQVSDTNLETTVEVVPETEANYADFRAPLRVARSEDVGGIIPLRVFIEGGGDHVQKSDVSRKGAGKTKLLVSVKWKGRKTQFKRKDGTKSEKRAIGIFDDTMEALLVLWDGAVACTVAWELGKTVLLITSPSINRQGQRQQQYISIGLTRNSLVEVDPLTADAQRLRALAMRVMRKPEMYPQFPEDEVDWRHARRPGKTLKWTLHDIDRYARNYSVESEYVPLCIGILHITIMEVHASLLHRKRMLFSGSCCGCLVVSNSITGNVCENCQGRVTEMLPHPSLMGRLADDTGSLAADQILWSKLAWEQLFEMPVEELAELPVNRLHYFDEFHLFLRLTLIFAWSPELGRIAVKEVVKG